MVIIFDLDDTLYEELSFVRSGFKAVADYLSPILNLSKEQIAVLLMDELHIQRDHVFDRLLEKRGVPGRKIIQNCLRVYRGHEPSIELFPEARACLLLLHDYPLYIVTDGNKLVQRKKYLALGLPFLVKRCFFTYAHGLHRSKPSPYCFEKICSLEKAAPSTVVYVADNPHKDFVGIKPLGFITIRVMKGPYRNDQVAEAFDADLKIPHLGALDQELLNTLMKGRKR